MQFTASTGSGGSFEKPKPGTYCGILIGVADIGTQDSGKFGAKKQILLRWELHKRRGPAMGEDGKILTATQSYTQSFGDLSNLRAAIEAHYPGPFAEGQKIDSKEWLGRAARLVLVQNDKWVNVDSVTRLDAEEDAIPEKVEVTSHWTPQDGTPCPQWANWKWERSVEHRTASGEKVDTSPTPAPAPAATTPMPTKQPTRQLAMAGAGAGAKARSNVNGVTDEADPDVPF